MNIYKKFPELAHKMNIKYKGKVALLNMPSVDLDDDVKANKMVQNYQKYLRLNQIHKSAYYNFPNMSKRLLEVKYI
jgi:hypothetical protein